MRNTRGHLEGTLRTDTRLTGLTPGKTVYVRLRGFNRNGHGVWATSAGILVL